MSAKMIKSVSLKSFVPSDPMVDKPKQSQKQEQFMNANEQALLPPPNKRMALIPPQSPCASRLLSWQYSLNKNVK